MQCPIKSKRWERRKEARPQELLAAALDLFVERGFAATRLDDVAARAGVSKGTLYLYFTNKEELFKAVVRENMLPMIDEAEGLIDQHQGNSASLFQEIMLGWWERVGNSKVSGITKLIMAESGNFPEVARFYYEEVTSRVNGMIVRMLEHGIARGEFRPIDPQQAMRVVVAPMVMLMIWNQSFGACNMEQISPQDYIRTYIDICLRGLLQDPTTPLPPARMPC
ncbi:TetR/AcrR family transcriptional regulator [Noviherbaspirillum sedimenti]|uniref:TetR/AcrR family transcriptional regulator n=1 Tax=Noviherbaspirillum sedimenti TaxID=2320865 RepID=A0A3A3G9Y6_9BURK|nr:TetR/AcrR family transcriptional regulator [Noviherbaspirillum sedimenti]RJG04584.1 TetR/AcrR family transcriptional regulator [Noviherbaspirillum sedimenti]